MIKKHLINSRNIERDSFIWNMTGSLLTAFQSVILLIILTHNVDLVTAGIFTIANANAALFLTVGKFGMRNFHVSDVRREYSFREYHRARVLTICLMMISSMIYLCYATFANDYTIEKTMIILWMCVLKLPDAYEDVYYAEYQRNGRLDVGAKAMTIRLVATIIIFASLVAITKNLLFSVIVSSICSLIIMWYLLSLTREIVGNLGVEGHSGIKRLLLVCLPVFFASFLSFYIGNAPKYAIDSQLSDDLQAIYGFISMPVFVIGLLNGFVFNPIVYTISCMWEEKRVSDFVKAIIKQTGIVLGITVVCVLGAYVLGIPVLSVLYNTDLTEYKLELLLLLVGGGFLGAAGVYTTVLTIIRRQRWLMTGYVIVALGALVGSSYVVARWGIMGAVILYDLLMLELCIVFVAMIGWGVKVKKS